MSSVGTQSPGRLLPEVDLEELRRPILLGLCLVAIAISWLWIAIVATSLGQQPQLEPLSPPLVMMLAAAITLVTVKSRLRLRSAFLLLGVGVAFLLGFLWTGSTVWLYYQSLLITVTALLAGPGTSFISAAALTGGSAVLLALRGTALDESVFAALGLVWATAVISWLSSRNLYTVLFWALDSQARAWRTANEVRRRREQLRRTLDSLRNAHFALERTTRELEAARIEAEEARKVKSRFVANISHELRTPLNIIVGFAEVLCFSPETYGEFTWPAALRDDILTIWRNAEHLLNMIDDVLDLAQIEASRLPVTPEPTDLPQLIRDTLVTASSLLRDSGLELRVVLPSRVPMLNLDRTRIRQVLLNLINNAVRFTSKGYIEVGGYLDGDEVVTYVRDSGEGISVDKLESIFEEFEQADTSIRRHHQGIGLGLTISRHFIRLHGGRMWAESKPGEGSVFYFSLPLPQSQPAIQPVEARRFRPQRSEAAEDRGFAVALCRDPIVVRLLERHLENLQVLSVNTLPEAVSLVQDWHPELVFVAADSEETLPAAIDEARRLLKAVRPIDLPVVVGSFPTERRAGMALGVAEFLMKPVTQKEVLLAIKRLCEQPRRILVADDEADMLALLRRITEREWPQAEVLAAASGEEALGLLAQRPDVILLDLLMPGMNGVDFLANMRTNPECAHIPVVVITARGPAQDLAAVSMGEVYLVKNSSFTAGELVRLFSLVTRGLPPNYATVRAIGIDSPTIAPT